MTTVARALAGVAAEFGRQAWAIYETRRRTWAYRLDRRYPAHTDDVPHHPGGIR